MINARGWVVVAFVLAAWLLPMASRLPERQKRNPARGEAGNNARTRRPPSSPQEK